MIVPSTPQPLTNLSLNSQPSTLNRSTVWDGDWAILEEYDASGNLFEGYVQGYHGLVKTMVSNVYYYQDELRSTSHVADGDGNLLEYYKYDLYGKPTYWTATTPSSQLLASAYGVRDLHGGARYVPEIGLYDDRNRFMSPDLGRFLQPDPIGFKGDASNLYRYVGNNWANRIDPMGLEPEVFLIRDYVSGVSINSAAASRAAGTYFIVDNGKMLGSWRANKDAPKEFQPMRTDSSRQSTGVAPGRYEIRPKAEDGKSYKKGQPAITGLAPGLKPGQANKSFPEGSALIHGQGQSRGCVTVPNPAESMTKQLMDQNGGRLNMQIQNGTSNRAQPVTDSKGNFINGAKTTDQGSPGSNSGTSSDAQPNASSTEDSATDGTNLMNDSAPSVFHIVTPQK